MSSFLAALVITFIACCTGLCPVFYAAVYKPRRVSISVMAATAIRLLLMIAGSAAVILYAKVNILSFAAWIILFYFITIALEICFAVFTAKRIINFGGDKV
jgi:hypothetical protein